MADSEEKIHSFKAARAKWDNKSGKKKSARREQEKKLEKIVDKRMLRATGRTEIFSFRCSDELKEICKRVAKNQGLTIAEWMELTLRAAVEAEEDNANA